MLHRSIDHGIYKIKFRTLGFWLLAAALAGCSSTSTTNDLDDAIARLDTIATEHLERSGVPGIAIAVVHDDEVVYARGFGVREAGTGAAVDADTAFQLASLSKPIGASAIAGLVGDGTLRWTDPIVTHLPEFALSNDSSGGEVTLEDMYAHRSGLPGGAGDLLEILGFDRAEILHRLRLLPLRPLRSQFAYSNFGMTTGGEAAARGAGVPWESLVRDRLFAPLGMSSTSSSHADFETRSNRATIHRKVDGVWRPTPFPRNPDAQSPAGGVTSTVNDLARWMRMMLASGAYDGRQVIDPDALHDMTRARTEEAPASADHAASFYALGIYTTTDHTGRERWSHSGIFDAGASTTCVMIPSEGLGIVVLTNGQPEGVPEAVAATFLDEALVGRTTRDWLAHYHALYAAEPPVFANLRPSPAAPPRPASAYVGTYANDYYGPALVTASAEGLVLQLGPRQFVFPLSPWDGDTFTLEHVREFTIAGDRSLLHFAMGADGRASSVRIELLDADRLGTFTRE